MRFEVCYAMCTASFLRSSVSTSTGHLKLLLDQSQDISLQLRSDVPAVAEALASLRRAYK